MIDIVMGCQYGSEGKGLIADIIACENGFYEWLISVNSAQAGHTVYYNHPSHEEPIKVVTRQLPSSCINHHESYIYIGAGALINPFVLDAEIDRLEQIGIPIKERLFISEMATIITRENIEEEEKVKLQESIGSTCEGVGSAQKDRTMRKGMIAREFYHVFRPEMKKFELVSDATRHIKTKEMYHPNTPILLEGSQGYLLSVFDKNYPYCTSRPVSASAFLTYADLPPTHVSRIYGVFRTFPIRVGGNSGFMKHETSWEEVAQVSGYPELSEYTTVTGRLRRIGYFDNEEAKRAIKANGITNPVLTFANYLDSSIEGCTQYEELTRKVKNWIEDTEKILHIKFDYISGSRYSDKYIKRR